MADILKLIENTVRGGSNKELEKVDIGSFATSDSVIGLYFSAHWCPPCRHFTPDLKSFYLKAKEAGHKFEIVFVSCDRDEQSWKEYFDDMPWLSLDYDDQDKKDHLMQKFGVSGIPSLVLLDGATGNVITKEGRAIVNGDPNASNFPWKK